MSVSDDKKSQKEKNKRRFLSLDKKFRIYLESQDGKSQVGEILRREGVYSTDLARIRKQAKIGAFERLSARPGTNRKLCLKKTIRP